MKKVAAILSLVLTTPVLFSSINVARAQQKPVSVVGAIAALDPINHSATIRTDSGASILVKTNDTTVCVRIPAGEKSLSNAVPIKFAEIAIGDRVLGHGTKTDQTFTAQRLVVMPASEVARKREHDLDDWKQRGRLARTFGFGTVRAPARAQAATGPAGGPPKAGTATAPPRAQPARPEDKPYKLILSMYVANLFNHNNPGTPIGNLSSPQFGTSNSLSQISQFTFGASAAQSNRSVSFRAQFTF